MPPSYRFGEFELDPGAYRLLRSGEQVKAEPKVLELLTYLIVNRDRTISKEELLREIWQGRFVGESALTRCIYEVRSVLGDVSQIQRYIKTIHGRGYQFVGELTGAQEVRQAEPAVAPAVRRSHRLPIAFAITVSVFGLVALAVALLFRQAPQELPQLESGSEPLVHRLAILPISASDEDPELELTALSLTDLLWVRLSGASGLLVRSPAYSQEASTAEQSLASFAASARVTHVLSGNLRPSPVYAGKANLEVTLHAVSGSKLLETPLGTYNVPFLRREVNLAEFTRVREAIVERLLANLAGAMDLAARPAHEPRNPEAFRLYLLARRRLQSLTCDAGGARELLKRSLELDERFVMAWVALGFAEYNEVWACGRGALFAKSALKATERALELEPGNPWATWLRVALLTELGMVEEAYDLADNAVRHTPREPALHLARSYSLLYAGFLPQARNAVERVLELDPLFLEEAGEPPYVYLFLGEWDRFLSLLPASGTPFHRFYQGYAEYRRGRPGPAAEALSPAFRISPNDVFARLSFSLLTILEGNQADARNIVQQLIRQRREVEAVDGAITFKEAQLLALAGDRAGSLEQLEAAVDQGFFCRLCISSDPGFVPLQGDSRFDRLLSNARKRHLTFARRFDLRPEGAPSALP